MKRNKALKIGAYALAGVVLGGALVFYNFIEQEDIGAIELERCPDFTIDTVYSVENDDFVLSNDTFSVAEHLGDVIVINFWRTDCEPCKKEIPHFNTLYETYQDQGLEVVIVSADVDMTAQGLLDNAMNKETRGTDNPRPNPDYEKYYQYWTDYSCAFAKYDVNNDVKGLFSMGDGLPVTIVINRQGIIKHILEIKMETYELLESYIAPLLAE